jgi:hypothetical protein
MTEAKRLRSKPREFRGTGHNFMTPNVLSYWRVGKLAVELSKGEGFSHNAIYGVTVRGSGDEKKDGELSKMFHNIGLAQFYIDHELADILTPEQT